MREQLDDPRRIAVVDLERLYAVEEEFSDATSLAIITVDARGVPVTEQCGFSDFCLEIRKDPIRRMRCYSCDAHGGLQAAIEGRPHIYRCHTGLIDFSVPIIIDDQYVGAILCGQVKIDQRHDDPDFHSNIYKAHDFLKQKHRLEITKELLDESRKEVVLLKEIVEDFKNTKNIDFIRNKYPKSFNLYNIKYNEYNRYDKYKINLNNMKIL